MASESVATTSAAPATRCGSTHDLWIKSSVLTVRIDKNDSDSPPEFDQCRQLNETIQGLARAAKAVIYQADNDTTSDAIFCMQPIEDIADAIILLSQLSRAVQSELADVDQSGKGARP